jgi:hypothetical protein
MPTHAIAHGPYAGLLESQIIFAGKLIVTRGVDEVETLSRKTSECFATRKTVRRTLETADPKALKD